MNLLDKVEAAMPLPAAQLKMESIESVSYFKLLFGSKVGKKSLNTTINKLNPGANICIPDIVNAGKEYCKDFFSVHNTPPMVYVMAHCNHCSFKPYHKARYFLVRLNYIEIKKNEIHYGKGIPYRSAVM